MDYMNRQQTREGRGRLKVVFGDVVLGVHGDGFEYLFSYAAGGMVSLTVNGREWLYRAPRPVFWRGGVHRAQQRDRGPRDRTRHG